MVVILLVAAAVVGGAYIALNNATFATTTVPQVSGQGLGSQSAAQQALMQTHLYKSLAGSTHVNVASLVQPFNSTNASQIYNASYSGSAQITAKLGGISVPITVPIQISVQRYYNDSSTQVAISSIPVVGSKNITMVKLNSTLYTCTPSSLTSSSSPLNCSQSAVPQNSSIGILSVASSNLNLTVGSVSTGIYQGLPCVVLNTTFATQSNSSAQSASPLLGSIGGFSSGLSGGINSCIYEPNYLPLTLAINAKIGSGANATTVAFTIHETSMNSQTSAQAIAATIPRIQRPPI